MNKTALGLSADSSATTTAKVVRSQTAAIPASIRCAALSMMRRGSVYRCTCRCAAGLYGIHEEHHDSVGTDRSLDPLGAYSCIGQQLDSDRSLCGASWFSAVWNGRLRAFVP